MDLVPALVAGIGLPALATLIGLVVRSRDGRLRAGSRTPGTSGAAEALGLAPDALGTDATLVQFSTSYCSRCPGTARALGDLADAHDADVRHVEIDLTDDAPLADRFDVRQTPTVLVLDAAGRIAGRIAGVPRTGELRTLIDDLTRRNRVPQRA
ncbi:TlpA family protein disulfide reductase [Agromyces indicus]|uniref:Thioredoxin family protein n=1 Tax=Agromyces indicus TaxID=758919 RepID=A0ABU1FP42_9MICO|nr:thioredoxin family protein [Agromyces indicus]MDR5693082.1 thioredoxin family protein [Agromyces indicus]